MCKDHQSNVQALLVDFHNHLPSQLRLLAIAPRPTALLRPPQPESERDTPASCTPQQDHHVESAHLALLAGGVGPANPRTASAEWLADHAYDEKTIEEIEGNNATK